MQPVRNWLLRSWKCLPKCVNSNFSKSFYLTEVEQICKKMAKTDPWDTKFISPVKFQTSAPKHWHTELPPRNVGVLWVFFLSGENVFLQSCFKGSTETNKLNYCIKMVKSFALISFYFFLGGKYLCECDSLMLFINSTWNPYFDFCMGWRGQRKILSGPYKMEDKKVGNKALAESKVESESSGHCFLNNVSNKGKSKIYFWKLQWWWLDSVNIFSIFMDIIPFL